MGFGDEPEADDEATIIKLGVDATRQDKESPTPVEKIEIAEELPIMPLADTVIYPHIVAPLLVTEESLIKLIDDALAGDRIVGIVTTKDEVESFDPENLYDIGSAVAVARMFKLPDGKMQLLVQGIARMRVEEFTQTEPYLKAKVERLGDRIDDTVELEGLARNALNLFRKIVNLAPYLPDEIFAAAINVNDPNDLSDFLAANINLDTAQKQELLEELDVKERLRDLTVFLNHEVEVLEIGSKIQDQVQSELSKGQREFFLREQLKAIQKELGEVDDRTTEINELSEAIDESGMSEEARKESERELDRLAKMPAAAAEYTVARTYLDWMVSLPWNVSTEDSLDVKRAATILDEDHYGLEKVKDRIVEYLAVRNIKEDTKGPILCFVGPPGVGKTSLGKSIARALGRKFHRISLGGVRDEAEIRGHRRTYVGALPGRVIQGLRKAGTNNPVFMLDEVDKMGVDFRGDPAAALLEVLDPEQNNTFSDHYLDVQFDLSKVMFITTANVLFTVPPALLDRMEVLELSGYTEPEKVKIAQQFLTPRQLEEHGLEEANLKIDESALRGIILNYTREAGVRNLEREIAAICRKTARKVAEGEKGPFEVTGDDLHDLLGPIEFRQEVIEQEDEVGVSTGLAWTEFGGDVLFVEVESFPGKGKLSLTGKLGDVMQESAKAAVTYARANAQRLGIDDEFFEKNDLHIHVPAGAIPKDGPSAGVTMAAALVSEITGRPVVKDTAMTGEITLRGKVLPVGGIKQKVLAAHRAGVKRVILPEENEKDLEEVPEFVKGEMEFLLVKDVNEIIEQVLGDRLEGDSRSREGGLA
ncbi:MAG: endopeptidase La [Actinobacteria bacterium]|nr:endopeptidase La [Actinomycetota bacterium]MBU4240259.1 endopeptidase La [Actinomycetota bacterium]MBU4302676.1 endopeptidase La [Actinomycetota bacterium]MBU4489852.1 endopeptidase La [Actinomycetota bacterium]